jgi:hypothetical protein
MRKAILLLCMVILLTGCSKDKDKDTSISVENSGMVQTERSADAKEKPDRTVSQEDKDKQTPDTAATSPTSVPGSDQDKSTPDITDLMKEGEVTEFIGSVGEAGIHMSLSYQDGNLTGSYYYDKYKTKININGFIDNIYLDYTSFRLWEDTDQEGQFIALFINQDLIMGCWKNETKVYPMYLIRSGAAINPPKAAGKDLMELEGEWYGKNANYFSGSELTIRALFEDLLYFDLNAFNGTATGSLDGFMFYKEGTAGVAFRDHIIWNDPASEHVSFEIRKKDDELSLISNQYDYCCGLGVAFDHVYSREEGKHSMPSATEVGITANKEEEELFSQIVHYRDYAFIQNTQSVMYEDILLDGRAVRAGASMFRGAAGMCYYINGRELMYAAVYEDGVIQYYTNDPKYSDHMPRPMAEWAESFDCEVIYNEINAPYPFDSSIPNLLVNQIDQLKKKQAVKLPSDYTLMDYCFGDLNRDGQEDFAAVIEQGSGKFTGSRRIYLFLKQKGTYVPAFENSKILLGSMEGGVFGDPYAGIELADGKFHINDYGGSSSRWGHTYTFTYQNDKLLLSDIRVDGMSTFTLGGIRETYLLLEKRAEFRSSYEADDTDRRKYDHLLLYEGRIKLSEEIPFVKAYAWCEEDLILEPEYPMPDLYSYEYGLKETAEARLTAEEVLDMVQKKYHPNMKMIMLPCSQEILNNYSTLLGYQVPTYYYSDGDHELYYFNRSSEGEEQRIIHTVFYDSLDKTDQYNFEFYQVYDDTGEISH